MTVAVLAHSRCLPEGDAPRMPDTAAWFDPAQWLGRRGHRHLPLPAQLALAASRGLAPTQVAGEEHGLWLGSASAAQHCLHALDTRILHDGAGSIGPMSAPYFSVNLVPSRTAQELGTTAGAMTVTTPDTAALDALVSAARAVALGRVRLATAVAVETGHDPVLSTATASSAPAGPCSGAPEFGAAALRLGRGGGREDSPDDVRPGHRIGLQWASGFVHADPGEAVARILRRLRSTGPVAVYGPGAPSEHPSARPGAGLAAFVAVTRAVTSHDPLTVVLAGRRGGATAVTVVPAGPQR